MKIILLLFFFTSTCYSQKEYKFDYFLEYKLENKRDNITKSKYYLTNSKDNSYSILLVEKDSLTFKATFLDFNGNYSVFPLKKESFYKAQFINIDCNIVTKFNSRKISKKYTFSTLKDSTINSEKLQYYKFHSKKNKKKIGEYHYLIKPNTQFHLPLLNDVTEFEVWNCKKTIPNGIYSIKTIMTSNKTISFKETLKRVIKINKSLIIPKKCDYTTRLK